MALTAYARQNDEVCEREFSLRIIKEPQTVVKDIYSECGLVKSSTNGFTPIITSGAGYPMVEHDDVLGDDCLVFFADSTRSEAYRKIAPYAAAKVSVKAKIRVDAVESKGVNFYMQDANAFNIARINVMSGVMLLTHGASDGSTNMRTTLIPSIDTEKFYDIELAIDYTKNTFAVLVDQKMVAANMPFMVNASAPGVPVSVLFGANSESAAKLKVARLEIYADAPEISDAEACRVDAAAIDFDASQPLTADFEVATAGANGTKIEWSSSDDSIISFENGKASVNRPDAVSGDGTVTITATVTRGADRAEKSYTVTVACVSDEEAVKTALEGVAIPNRDSITSDIALPAGGAYGVSFSWTSSDSSVVSNAGKVSRSSLSSDKNVALTLTAMKNSYSETKKFTVTVKAGKSSESLGSSGGGGGSSSGSGISISVSQDLVTKTQPQQESFSDLAGYEWARESIDAFSKAGYVSGVGDGRFEPSRSVTREEFVSILVRALGLYDASAECSFEDVAPEHWSYRYVASAVKAKAVYGIDENNFGMSRPISRRDMCVMLLRGLNAVGCTVAEGEAVEFDDAESIGSYAQKAVLKLASAGVVAGMGDGMFMPEAAATRAQTVHVIHTALGVKTAGSDNLEPAPTEEPVRDGRR